MPEVPNTDLIDVILIHSRHQNYKIFSNISSTVHEGATYVADENDDIIEEVRQSKNVYIDWRSNLQYIMRREYLRTDTCDFALSSEEVRIST